MKKKILDKLNELELEPVRIYKCNKAGDIVDNGYGMEFALPKYAVITKKDLMLGPDEVYIEFSEFEFKNDIDTLKFCSEHYDVEGLHGQLEVDGYELIWSK